MRFHQGKNCRYIEPQLHLSDLLAQRLYFKETYLQGISKLLRQFCRSLVVYLQHFLLWLWQLPGISSVGSGAALFLFDHRWWCSYQNHPPTCFAEVRPQNYSEVKSVVIKWPVDTEKRSYFNSFPAERRQMSRNSIVSIFSVFFDFDFSTVSITFESFTPEPTR